MDSDSMMSQLPLAMLRSYTTCFYKNFLNEFFKALPTMMIADQMHLARNFVRFHSIA
ncbi:hypothetical protein CIT292_07007 [Citrobacter youngae ATCC 29220]|uniref:Uncharacterized protein n=1 Tax=Citrobacter youngae ATCC 29220 TaxID=500640 RepID=D4B966_9ENTR|nr:hypothetical protein CIT292_07007 [Citrobacter youngae ATCC 29220]